MSSYKNMIIVVDIGNTNIVIGLFKGESLIGKWRIATTNANLTEDEYAAKILPLFNQIELDLTQIEGVIISSVVRKITKPFSIFVEKCLRQVPVIVSDVKHDIKIMIDDPNQLGMDILTNAFATNHIFNEDCIFIDFGTATVIAVINKAKEFFGGLILPGISTSFNSLVQSADMLLHTPLLKPAKIIGKNTGDCMRSGMFYMYKESVNGIIKNIKKEFDSEFKVVATGGDARLIQGEISEIDIHEPDLTLKGLSILYNIHRNK